MVINLSEQWPQVQKYGLQNYDFRVDGLMGKQKAKREVEERMDDGWEMNVIWMEENKYWSEGNVERENWGQWKSRFKVKREWQNAIT